MVPFYARLDSYRVEFRLCLEFFFCFRVCCNATRAPHPKKVLSALTVGELYQTKTRVVQVVGINNSDRRELVVVFTEAESTESRFAFYRGARFAGPCLSKTAPKSRTSSPNVAATQQLDSMPINSFLVQQNLQTVDQKGTLNNFKNGTLDGYATSVYRIGDGLVMGSRVFASWSTAPGNSPSQLFYDDGDAPSMVQGVVCTAGATSHTVFLSGGEDGQEMEEWGTATDCDAGPAPLNATVKECPPVILLSGGGGGGGNNLHMIVEEDSSYPSFLYSVWRPVLAGDGTNTSEPAELRHVFYVSSTTRLAEAIVSGVVNGIMSGGGCVDLLSQFSVANTTYDLAEMSRVAPFGEYPSFASVESIDDVEEIVAGVKVSDVGLVCGLILLVVTGASFVGCLGSMKSRADMDVFDRDAVIRAVALPNGAQEADITSPGLKIYVRQSDETRFGMVVSDDTTRRRWINRCVEGVASAVVRSSHTADGDDEEDDEPLPARGLSRSWSLPRASFTRVSSDRGHLDLRSPDDEAPVRTPPAQSPTYVELVASPIPSLVRGASVLRGLPTFFSSSMTASRLDDSSTDRAHSSLTDHGQPSPGAGSRPTKGGADSVLQSALHGKEAPPPDAALPTTGDVDILEPEAESSHHASTTTDSLKMAAAATGRTGGVAGKQTQAGAGADAAGVVGTVGEGAGEGVNREANIGARRHTTCLQEKRRPGSSIGSTGVQGAQMGGCFQSTRKVGADQTGDSVASQAATALSGRSVEQVEGRTDSPCGDGDVCATTPANPVGGGVTTELQAGPGGTEFLKTE